MKDSFLEKHPLPRFSLWDKFKKQKDILSFELELTARCNNNCRHCYINLPADDKIARKEELSIKEIEEITEEAISLGALWCLLTGGEPLLRKDFFDIYLCLKKRGLLVSIFTNATLITKRHIELFKKYPPRDIEITVYGVTCEVYEKITQKTGSFNNFMRGLELLLENRIKVRLKTMVMRSNIHQFSEIARFCRRVTNDYFRFDPFLHLRFDSDPVKNNIIKKERLTPDEIVLLERGDLERFNALQKNCDKFITKKSSFTHCNHLFHCGAGETSFTISPNGYFRLCSSLWHPECIYNLREGTLSDAYRNFVPKVKNMQSENKEFIENCRNCNIVNLCMWCPANAYLETGQIDSHIKYFCEVARARAEMIKKPTHTFCL